MKWLEINLIDYLIINLLEMKIDIIYYVTKLLSYKFFSTSILSNRITLDIPYVCDRLNNNDEFIIDSILVNRMFMSNNMPTDPNLQGVGWHDPNNNLQGPSRPVIVAFAVRLIGKLLIYLIKSQRSEKIIEQAVKTEPTTFSTYYEYALQFSSAILDISYLVNMGMPQGPEQTLTFLALTCCSIYIFVFEFSDHVNSNTVAIEPDPEKVDVTEK